MESFKEYFHQSSQEHINKAVANLRFVIQELYFESLLSEEEAKELMHASTSVDTMSKLGELELMISETGALGLKDSGYSEGVYAEIVKLREVFLRDFDSMDASNWTNTFSQFIETLPVVDGESGYGRLVQSWTSRLLEKAYFLERAEGETALTFGHTLALLLKGIQVSDLLRRENKVLIGKRQPSFMESVDSTLDHFEYIEQLPSVFGESIEALIVGGSMSYGPFFNIRSNIDKTGSSDVDAIFIISDAFSDNSSWDNFSSSNIVTPEDKRSFLHRKDIFLEMYQDGVVDVFSHRFSVPDRDFTMSAHFFTPETFKRMNTSGLAEDLKAGGGSCIIRDYKAKNFEHTFCSQRTFTGAVFNYEVPEQVKVNEGVITQLPGYIISDGSLYPGLYQNLISPEFSVFHDTTGETNGVVSQFKQILEEEVQRTATVSPEAALWLSHPRNPVFAPERYSS